jgi:putative salt-induced outer membrane protein
MRNWIGSALLVLSVAVSGLAQAPADMPVYTGSFGGGFALTGGNTDTRNFNLAFDLTRDPKTRNVVKVTALYLRGSQDDVLSLDRASFLIRDEYTFSSRVFLFAQNDYLRDQFKDIRYLVSPSGGLGYKVINSDETKLSFSGGAGGVWEKNTVGSVRSSGSVNASQSFSRKLSSTATLTQSIESLAKTNDFTDTLTTFKAGITTSINSVLELKFELLDSYKNRPPSPAIEKNDTAFVMAFVVKY